MYHECINYIDTISPVEAFISNWPIAWVSQGDASHYILALMLYFQLYFSACCAIRNRELRSIAARSFGAFWSVVLFLCVAGAREKIFTHCQLWQQRVGWKNGNFSCRAVSILKNAAGCRFKLNWQCELYGVCLTLYVTSTSEIPI